MLTVILTVAVVAGCETVNNFRTADYRQVTECQEDAVLVGAGDFHAGRYERYECGPSMDDYAS